MKASAIVFLAVCLSLVLGCRKNSAQIAEQVKVEMQQDFTRKPGLKDLVIERVRLVRQSDEDFSGVAVGSIKGEYVKFNVSCKYDGTSILWDANLPEEELDALKLKESARETYQLLKETWPKVKSSIGEKYDTARKSVEEGLEAAKKKASEYYDRAKEKAAELIEETSSKPNEDVAPVTQAESAKE